MNHWNHCIHIIISGKVQGVSFRSGVQQCAMKFGIYGWTGNREDGSVEIVAEGPEEKLVELLQWCWRGSTTAKVENVEYVWEEPSNAFETFEIC